MSLRTIGLGDALYTYILDNSLREHDALRRLREATAALPHAGMQSSPEQAQLMALLIELMGARRALEIGTFTGHGALAIALALPADGQLVALDVNDDWTAMGRRYWREAGVEHKIDLRLGLALESLDGLLAEGAGDSFDFAFIDADKKTYDAYYERCLRLVRPGGLIAIDNVLWGGAVADPANNEKQTRSLRALNARILADERISRLSLVPIGDGLTLARRRS